MDGIWITSEEASQIATEKHKRPISQAQIRQVARGGKIRTKKLHARTSLYHRRDVEQLTITQHDTSGQTTGRAPGRPRKDSNDQAEDVNGTGDEEAKEVILVAR